MSNLFRACLRLRSSEPWDWLLLSQVWSLSMVCFIDEEMGFPDKSLVSGLIFDVLSHITRKLTKKTIKIDWILRKFFGNNVTNVERRIFKRIVELDKKINLI